MMVTVKDVKKEFHDKSLQLSTAIISLMNADSITLGSVAAVMWLKYPRERLTSGVCHKRQANGRS